MANLLQKVLLSLSITSPVVICIGIVNLIQRNKLLISISLIVVGVIFSLYYLLFIHVCKNKLSVTPIMVGEISPNDGWNIVYIVTYISPFTNIVFEQYNIYFSLVVALIIAVILIFSNTTYANPIILLFGYHSYKIKDVSGNSDKLLLCRKKHVKTISVKNVYTVFDTLLINKED